ncbi:MAG: hypothetical protein AMXMBFR84_37480 [Candidatus Hydrogenedentota bacterium]
MNTYHAAACISAKTQTQPIHAAAPLFGTRSNAKRRGGFLLPPAACCRRVIN